MSVLKNTGSRSNTWSVGLGIILAVAACGGEDPASGDDDDDGKSTESATDDDDDDDDDSTGGNTKTDAGTKKDAGGGSTKTDSGTKPSMVDGGTTTPKGDGGSGGTTSPKGDGGGGGGTTTPKGGDGTMLGDCEEGDKEPCSVVTSPRSGEKIQLGPYGVLMISNVGQGYESTVNTLLDNEAGCALFAATFAEDAEETERLLDLKDLDLSLHTVYMPAVPAEGEKYPIVSWGNGTCAQPEGYGTLLRYVASHGFIVVAPNSRYVGSGQEQIASIDFVIAASKDANSPLYNIVDTGKVGVMGHSQGGGSAIAATRDDPRVMATIIFNGGNSAVKPFFAISGDMDIGDMNVKGGALAAPKAAYMYFHDIPGTGTLSGHLTLMTQPERLMDATVQWWKMMLSDDAEAKGWFVGSDCKLCGHENDSANKFEYGQNGLD